jgi:hypothetical protein
LFSLSQNLKQKFMALMKKFKVEGIGRAEQVELDRELSEAAVDPAEIDYLVSHLPPPPKKRKKDLRL